MSCVAAVYITTSISHTCLQYNSHFPVSEELWDCFFFKSVKGLRKAEEKKRGFISAFGNMDRIFVLACLFTAFVGLGQCLECHECVTIESDACLDPYDGEENADNMGECDPGSHCLKYKTVVKIRDSGYIMGWERDSIVVTRACEPTNGLPTGCVKWQGSGGFTIKCRCDSDGCNSAGFLQAGVMTVAVTLLVLLCFIR